MSANSAAPVVSSRDSLSSAKAVAISGAIVLLVSALRPLSAGSSRWALVVPIVVALASRVWSLVVTHFVPEPYLDEVFHIPQAQKYCEGKWSEWDDKITTPPGLYVISSLFPKSELTGDLTGLYDCSPQSLRASSALGLIAIAYLAMYSRHLTGARLNALATERPSFMSQHTAHTALNIALFPLLFFFSGLYYTDVVSTAVVVGSLSNCLTRLGRNKSSVSSDLITIVISISALCMRQTNVFWVVVFTGGLEAAHAVKTLRPQRVDQPEMTTVWEHIKWFVWRYSIGDVHDPPVRMACPGDMLVTAVSLLVAAVCNLTTVLAQIWPYITVLASFVYFVIWNGGVVLGDKSNHVATIHLAQMLYIWPLFAFFSLPLLLPYLLVQLTKAWSLLMATERSTSPQDHTSSTKKAKAATSLKTQTRASATLSVMHHLTLCSFIPTAVYLVTTILLSLGIVHFNTIVHPFTLADNRHYMFYIFRYTIRRAWWVKYVLVMPYTLSRWLVWGALEGSQDQELSSEAPFISHPFQIVGGNAKRRRTAQYPEKRQGQTEGTAPESQQALEDKVQESHLVDSEESISTSTALIFLLATSLSLITAPLVEPRYFIIPWLFWRLFVPAWRFDDRYFGSNAEQGSVLGQLKEFNKHYDLRLVLETVWFVAINLATGWIFLTKPYQWRLEDGTLLDEGRLQRFMW